MRKTPFLLLLLIAFSHRSFGQSTNDNIIYIIDSVPVIDQPDESEAQLDPQFISDVVVVKNKDSLRNLGYEKMDGAIFIFTKEYRNRSEEIKRIPTTRRMTKIDDAWHLTGSDSPYSGKFIDYYYSGKERGEGLFKDGKLEGGRKKYYQNGNVLFERYYQDGLENDSDKEYYEDGSLNQKGIFINGKEQGVWEWYYPNGQVKLHTVFKNGDPIDSSVKYYSSGRLKEKLFIKDGKTIPDPRLEKILKFYNKGVDLEKEEDFTTAIKEYSKCIELDSLYAEGYFARGTAKLNNFQFDEAIADLDKAISIEPYFMEAFGNRVFCRIRKYQFKDNRTLESNSDITVMAGKENSTIPIEEKEKICSDLKQAVFLGDESKMTKEALVKYCVE